MAPVLWRAPTHLIFAAARRIADTTRLPELSPELAQRVADELAQPGALKPNRAIPTPAEVLALLQEDAAARAVVAKAKNDRLSAFEQQPIGNPELRHLLGDAEGRPVTPIRGASVFTDPAMQVTDVTDSRLPLNSAVAPFVRDLEDFVEPGYLQLHLKNLAASHHAVFLPALHDGSLFTNYLEVLRAQNTVVRAGLPEEPAVYGGYTGRSSETLGQPPPTDLGKTLSEIRLAAGQSTPTTPLFGYNSGVFIKARVEAGRIGPTRIEGLPPEAWPQMLERGSFHGPQTQYLPLYLDRMRDTLKASLETLDQPIGLQHLADYLQAASNTHLFERGNNSIFMSHVNYVLERRGLRPMSHGQLDIEAYAHDSAAFRSLFSDAVRAANPGAI